MLKLTGFGGNQSKPHIGSYKIIGFKGITSQATRIKLTQKMDHFTVFNSFPSISCCLMWFPPNKIENLASWTSKVELGILTLGG